MTFRLTSLFRDGAYYSAARVVTGLSFLIVLPLHTRYLDRSEVGVLAMTGALAAFLTHVVMLGFDNASIRFFFRSDAASERARVFATFYWIYLGLLLTAIAIVSVWSSGLARVLLGNRDLAKYLILACGPLPCLATVIVLHNWLKANERAHAMAIVATIQAGLLALSTWVCIAALGLGLKGAYIANIITLAVMAGIALLMMKDVLKPSQVDLRVASSMLSFSWPMIPALLAGWIATQADRLLLGRLQGADDVGLFHVAAFTGTAVAALIGGVATAVGPAALRNASAAGFRDEFARSLLRITGVWVAFGFGVACLAPEIVLVLGGEGFRGAVPLIAPIAFAQVLAGVIGIVSIGPVIAMSNWPSSVGIMLAAVATLVANLLLIPIYGALGASLAQLAGQLTGLVTIIFMAQRIYPVAYPFRAIGAWLLTGLGLSIWMTMAPPPIGWRLGLAVCAAVAIAVQVLRPTPTQVPVSIAS